MSLKVSGTKIWYYDAENQEVVVLGCPTSLDDITESREVFETKPCLTSGKREKLTGAITIEDFSVGVNFDMESASHIRLREIFTKNTGKIPLLIGFSDGEDSPTYAGGAWTLADSRSWIEFTVSVSSQSISFPENGAVEGSFTFSPTDLKLTAKAGE